MNRIKDPEVHLMGAFTTGTAANLRVMDVCIMNYHEYLDLRDDEGTLFSKGEKCDDITQAKWWIGEDGMLSIRVREAAGEYRICATKMKLRDSKLRDAGRGWASVNVI
ncbi:Uu.00g049040.m01.CDS01 [Anthostomella pinea]|uniref:Uu.00g049040.m01.CDS01 n=1 Tax=Anthostomella pinea TaxID=933095 RepID=A0AAI8YEN3_9PEZI|nr:Uu.00g049040.m01.CDS01 [Anthostomella pinea]